MHKALLYNSTPKKPNTVQCTLCPHTCIIKDGYSGICKTRKNINGILYALNYGRLVAARPDPIEKKPLYHYYPNHSSFSVSSVGCNLSCQNCQNSSISQQDIDNIPATITSPQDVINSAVETHCQSIAFTYTEPTTLLEFILDTAKLSTNHNLKNIMVSNGYMSDKCIDHLIPYLHAINIDLKSFSNSFYAKICKATLAPILNTISRLHHAGVHVEITTLLIPSLNDDTPNLKRIASFIESIHPEIPWHISRFHPSYKLKHIPSTPTQTLLKAFDIGKEQGLKHLYIGNAPEISTHTYCHHCNSILFRREGYSTTRENFKNKCCTQCKTKLFGEFI